MRACGWYTAWIGRSGRNAEAPGWRQGDRYRPGRTSTAAALVRFVPIGRAVYALLAEFGAPIAYAYVHSAFPLREYQKNFGRSIGSSEMPSAARPFTRPSSRGYAAAASNSQRSRYIAASRVLKHRNFPAPSDSLFRTRPPAASTPLGAKAVASSRSAPPSYERSKRPPPTTASSRRKAGPTCLSASPIG